MLTIQEYWFGFVVEKNRVAVSRAYKTEKAAAAYMAKIANLHEMSWEALDRRERRKFRA